MKICLCIYMIQEHNDCIIQCWIHGDRKWVEFRGYPYHKWTGLGFCEAEEFHDSLEGNHTSVLHSGDILHLHDGHKDFNRAYELYLGASK